jgi:hypothetical protein
MAYFHVIAKLAQESEPVCLFKDLTLDDLRLKFLRHYDAGRDFLTGAEVVSCKDIRSVRIIETLRDDETEREAINRRSRAEIDEINRSSESSFFISLGSGWEPEDIAEAGEDVTSLYIKGAPGHLSHAGSKASTTLTVSRKAWHEHSIVKATIAIIVAVVSGGLIYAFGWN